MAWTHEITLLVDLGHCPHHQHDMNQVVFTSSLLFRLSKSCKQAWIVWRDSVIENTNSCRETWNEMEKNHWGHFLEIMRHFVYFLVPTFILSCLMLSFQTIHACFVVLIWEIASFVYWHRQKFYWNVLEGEELKQLQNKSMIEG